MTTDSSEHAPLIITATEAEILRLLIARGESYGLDLVKASSGILRRGFIYVTLAEMVDKGLVEDREESSRPDGRRLYKATELGTHKLSAFFRHHTQKTPASPNAHKKLVLDAFIGEWLAIGLLAGLWWMGARWYIVLGIFLAWWSVKLAIGLWLRRGS